MCVGGRMYVCVGGGGGYQAFCFSSLHMVPLSQGLSPNLQSGWRPSVSKGLPVFSHDHWVDKEPHPTLYIDMWISTQLITLAQQTSLSMEPSLQSRLGQHQRGLTFWSCSLNGDQQNQSRLLRNCRTKTLLGVSLFCFVWLVPSEMLHCCLQWDL